MCERDTGVTLDGLLGLLFIGLKLGGVIDWSWWWVLAPFWAPFAVLAALFVALVPVMLVLAARRNNGWSAPRMRLRLRRQR